MHVHKPSVPCMPKSEATNSPSSGRGPCMPATRLKAAWCGVSAAASRRPPGSGGRGGALTRSCRPGVEVGCSISIAILFMDSLIEQTFASEYTTGECRGPVAKMAQVKGMAVSTRRMCICSKVPTSWPWKQSSWDSLKHRTLRHK